MSKVIAPVECFFEASARRKIGVWLSQPFRLFKDALDWCQTRMAEGSPLAYIKHIATDEAIWTSVR